MFRHLKGHHKVKILVIKHKKDVRTCIFVELRYQFHKSYFHVAVKYVSTIKMAFWYIVLLEM
jgi:hypothetical protein